MNTPAHYRIRRLAASAALVVSAVVLVVALGLPAHAGGSDSPTPYTVDAAGITLPAGEVFQAHGHVNVRTNLGDAGIHFDPYNNQPGGAWIGKSHIPWSAFGFKTKKVCVTWVQLSQFNEHFGEGGQTPVGKGCKPTSTPKPTPSPKPEPSPEPSPSTTPSPEPIPSPDPTPTPEPSVTPAPEPSSTPEPDTSVTPVPEPSEAPTASPIPGPEAERTSGASSTGPIYATPDTIEAPTSGHTDSTPVLASTGPAVRTPLSIAAVLALVGAGVVLTRKRWAA